MLYYSNEVILLEINASFIQFINPMLIVIGFLMIVSGYKKGFISKLLSCFSFIAIVFLSYKIAPAISEVIHLLPQEYAPFQNSSLALIFYNYLNQLLIFALLIAVITIVLMIVRPILTLFGELPIISGINAISGALFGMIEMILFVSVLTFLFETPLFINGQEVIDETFLTYVHPIQKELIENSSSILAEYENFNNFTLDLDLSQLEKWLQTQDLTESQISEFIRSLKD